MEAFVENLTSTYWWASVVIVGLLISVFAAYVKSGIDSVFGRFSDVWKNRTEKKLARFEELVVTLAASESEKIKTLAQINANLLRALISMMLAVLTMTMLVSWPVNEYIRIIILLLGGFAILMLASALARISKADDLQKALSAAEKR
ncbi:hypothetical protein ACIPZ5_01700 [Pseudomonas sp. NPDC089428]|uniref:hypothetical protein n=1 Tax=Pseudomonas sp. NPDC089428 TaxID=3364467 RepID=UPI00381FB524